MSTSLFFHLFLQIFIHMRCPSFSFGRILTIPFLVSFILFTQAFTLGSEVVDGESGTLQALSPRKRGAAGIRGLGAPGTAPSKQLVQRYCSLTAASNGGPTKAISPVQNSFTFFR